MKNILIPSTLHQDTLQAIKVALNDAKPTAITLLMITEPDDTASASSWLRQSANKLTRDQDALLDECYALVNQSGNCQLKVREQYSMTGPLLRGLLEYLDINMVIIPESFLQSTRPCNKHCVKLLRKGRYPLLQLAGALENPAFSKALFLQKNETVDRVGELLSSLEGFSNLSVVGQVPVNGEALIEPALFDTIHRKEIDLLVETRRPQKVKLTRKHQPEITEKLELPVLSLYEPIA